MARNWVAAVGLPMEITMMPPPTLQLQVDELLLANQASDLILLSRGSAYKAYQK